MTSMKRWVFGSLAVLLAVGMLLPAGTFQPAWANSELHLGARIVVPGWDVRGNRETYIVLTREDLTFGNTPISIVNSAGTSIGIKYTDPFDNCRPRGTGYGNHPEPSGIGNTEKVLVVDDLHVEYYGKSCINSSEVIHMSCGDIDLLLLSDNSGVRRPGFSASVAGDGVGGADIHYIINGTGPDGSDRKDENSLMGTVIIADVAEGWAAIYPAASAKSTTCLLCDELQGNTEVGYEPFPQEVFLPMAFADGAFQLSNLLFLFSPNLFPGRTLDPPTFDLNVRIWDGRERFIEFDIASHFLIRTLGDPPQSGQDALGSIFSPFQVANFVCGHAPGNLGDSPSPIFENDGAPRGGTSALACGPTSSIVTDTEHRSDNFDFQTSNPIGWWRFTLSRAGALPNFPGNLRTFTDNSGRGLVGVVLSTTPGAAFTGIGDATRLWHKDPCEVAQSADNYGPPHVRDASLFILDAAAGQGVGGSVMTIFNALTIENQAFVCALPSIIKSCLFGGGGECFTGGVVGEFASGFTAP